MKITGKQFLGLVLCFGFGLLGGVVGWLYWKGNNDELALYALGAGLLGTVLLLI